MIVRSIGCNLYVREARRPTCLLGSTDGQLVEIRQAKEICRRLDLICKSAGRWSVGPAFAS